MCSRNGSCPTSHGHRTKKSEKSKTRPKVKRQLTSEAETNDAPPAYNYVIALTSCPYIHRRSPLSRAGIQLLSYQSISLFLFFFDTIRAKQRQVELEAVSDLQCLSWCLRAGYTRLVSVSHLPSRPFITSRRIRGTVLKHQHGPHVFTTYSFKLFLPKAFFKARHLNVRKDS